MIYGVTEMRRNILIVKWSFYTLFVYHYFLACISFIHKIFIYMVSTFLVHLVIQGLLKVNFFTNSYLCFDVVSDKMISSRFLKRTSNLIADFLKRLSFTVYMKILIQLLHKLIAFAVNFMYDR